VFVSRRPFQPSLMFEGKAERGAPEKCSPPAGFGLTNI
jgi:hypothetical protein